MEIRDHIDTDVGCRHCEIGDDFLSVDLESDKPLVRKNYSYFWDNILQTGFLNQLTSTDQFMDHVVFSKYFAILQPYSYDPEKDNNYELHYSRFDKSVEEHGGKLYYVRAPGYHEEFTRTLIIVPDREKSKKWLSTVLGGLSLYKDYIKQNYGTCGAKEEMRIVNSLQKTLLENYVLPSPEHCFVEAMSYLTGNTVRNGFKNIELLEPD